MPNKQFGQLITITPHSLAMLKTTNAEFSFTEIWFTDQNNSLLEIEDNVNIMLIIGISYIKMRYKTESKYRRYIPGYGFLSFAKKFGGKYSKKINEYCNKNRNICCKKIGDRYGKNFMDTAKKQGTSFAKTAGKK